MKAMVLAAGLGTRLRPLTNDRPKALVELRGRTLLDRTLERLREAGIREVIVNVHHFADMMVDYLRANDNFGMKIAISREETLLDTGGGLKQASWFFAGSAEPFLVHNVDVASDFDFAAMRAFHEKREALATLAVQERKTSRPLLFDESLQLRGRGTKDGVEGKDGLLALAFAGIHVVSPHLFGLMTEEGVFSIVDVYLRLAAEGSAVKGYREDAVYWADLGKYSP